MSDRALKGLTQKDGEELILLLIHSGKDKDRGKKGGPAIRTMALYVTPAPASSEDSDPIKCSVGTWRITNSTHARGEPKSQTAPS